MRKVLGGIIFVVGGLVGGFNESMDDSSILAYCGFLGLAIFIMVAGVAVWKSAPSDPDEAD